MINEEGLKEGMRKYGPKQNAIEQSCVSCGCLASQHKGGKCENCDKCEGFSVTGEKPNTAGGPQPMK